MRVAVGQGSVSGANCGTEPHGFRHLPIELFSGPHSRFIFDAKKGAFIEVDEPLFSVLGLLREEDLEPGELTKRLSRFSESEVREAHRQFRKLQKEGYLVPGRFRRAPKYDRAHIEKVLSRKLGGFTVMISTQCNLACSCCIYEGAYRRYGKLSAQRMSWETARNMQPHGLTRLDPIDHLPDKPRNDLRASPRKFPRKLKDLGSQFLSDSGRIHVGFPEETSLQRGPRNRE